MNLDRALWPEGLVAGLATLAVAWPLTELLRDNEWVGTAMLMIALVVVVGAVLRGFGINPTIIVLVQFGAALSALMLTYLHDTLFYLLPTTETFGTSQELLQQAGQVLQQYAAPAPATEGVQFLIVSVLTLTAVSVDAIAVSGRAPATAGIPLGAAFLVSVSNNGQAMAPQYFLAVAAAWLVMLAQQGDRLVGGWSSADRRESVGSHDVSHGPTGHRTMARVLGGVTLVGALLGASVLPHLPPTFFGDGLATNGEANDLSPGGAVSFTTTMDLAADLTSRSDATVIRYRSDTFPEQPMRVTAWSVFDGRSWLAPDETPDGARQRAGDLRGTRSGGDVRPGADPAGHRAGLRERAGRSLPGHADAAGLGGAPLVGGCVEQHDAVGGSRGAHRHLLRDLSARGADRGGPAAGVRRK